MCVCVFWGGGVTLVARLFSCVSVTRSTNKLGRRSSSTSRQRASTRVPLPLRISGLGFWKMSAVVCACSLFRFTHQGSTRSSAHVLYISQYGQSSVPVLASQLSHTCWHCAAGNLDASALGFVCFKIEDMLQPLAHAAAQMSRPVRPNMPCLVRPKK